MAGATSKTAFNKRLNKMMAGMDNMTQAALLADHINHLGNTQRRLAVQMILQGQGVEIKDGQARAWQAFPALVVPKSKPLDEPVTHSDLWIPNS